MIAKLRKSRGISIGAVLILILLFVAAGAAYWFMRAGGAFGTAFSMADHLPKNARAAWLVSLRGQINPSEMKGQLSGLVDGLPEETKKSWHDAEKELGITFGELAAFFDGRAASAVLQGPGKPGVVALMGLRDSEGLLKFREAKRGKAAAKIEQVSGVDFEVLENASYFGQDKRWLYFADSKESAELLVGAATGKEALSAEPRFQEAETKVEGKGSLTAFYVDLGTLSSGMQSLNLPYTDAQTWKDLACLEYAVGSLDLKKGELNGFLKVTKNDSVLSQKLLSKGKVSTTTFQRLTGATNGGHAIDLEWTYNLLVGLAMASPETREYAGMASMGLVFYGNPWGAFQGDVAITGDWLEKASEFYQITGTPAASAPPKPAPQISVALAASVKDAKLVHGLVKKLMRTDIGEAPAPGADAEYPTNIPGATLKIVGAAPSQALLGFGPNAAALFDTKNGSFASKPLLKDALDWGGDGVIYADYMNLTSAMASAEVNFNAAGFPKAKTIAAVLKSLQNGSALEGASCLATRPDGLAWRSQGVSHGALIFGGMAVAVFGPDLVKARDQMEARRPPVNPAAK